MHIKILILSRDQKMKCFAYASSVEAFDPASFPFYGTVPVWKEICCASFFQPSLCRFHTYMVSVSFINATKTSKATNIVVCF